MLATSLWLPNTSETFCVYFMPYLHCIHSVVYRTATTPTAKTSPDQGTQLYTCTSIWDSNSKSRVIRIKHLAAQIMARKHISHKPNKQSYAARSSRGKSV